MTAELSIYPDSLFDPQIRMGDYRLLGLRFFDPADAVDLSTMVDITMEAPPDGTDFVRVRDGKPYCVTNGVETEFLWKDRIRSVLRKGGWLHLNGYYKFRIARGLVVEFAIYCRDLPGYGRYSKQFVRDAMGPPDLVEEDFDGPELFRSRLYYERKMMRFMYDDFLDTTGALILVNVGESLPASRLGSVSSIP